jgi:aryl-alcohol dehydrogenase-like predicted oxidoreductase
MRDITSTFGFQIENSWNEEDGGQKWGIATLITVISRKFVGKSLAICRRLVLYCHYFGLFAFHYRSIRVNSFMIVNMRKTQIPGNDLVTSAICLGTGGMGSSIDRVASFAMLDAFVAHGGNFLDSAKVYADWLPIERSSSEKTLGRWMKARGNRDRIIIGTKGAHPDLSSMHIPRMSDTEIASDVNASLAHLETDYIDLYWLHRDDPRRPAGEIIEALNVHIKAGKVRAIGCSNWRAERIEAAQSYAAAHGLQGFSGDQMLWSLAAVDPNGMTDKTLVAMDEASMSYHARTGLVAIPYSSQANGLFTKMAAGKLTQLPVTYRTPENDKRLARIKYLAADTGLTITQIALAYLTSQPFATIPIVGCRNMEQLTDSLSAGDITLTPEQLRFLTQ